VALGVGARELLLLRKSGDLKWKKKVIAVKGRFSGGLSFSNDDKFTLLQGEDPGVISVDGTAVWRGAGSGMGAARDLQTFVGWSSPRFEGGGGDIKVLDGCGAVKVLDGAGKELWHRVGPGWPGAITSSGDKIAAPVYVKQDMTLEECNDFERGSGRPRGTTVELQVFSRSGQLLKSIPTDDPNPYLMAMSPKGDRLLVQVDGFIEELDAEGHTILKIPVYNPDYRVPEDFTARLCARATWNRAARTCKCNGSS
jgi:hypothetical protein